MTITIADVSANLTMQFVKKSPQLEGSLIVSCDPRASHDWEVHGSCTKITVIIRTSPFDPHFRSHVKRAFKAACIIQREQTAASAIREH